MDNRWEYGNNPEEITARLKEFEEYKENAGGFREYIEVKDDFEEYQAADGVVERTYSQEHARLEQIYEELKRENEELKEAIVRLTLELDRQ